MNRAPVSRWSKLRAPVAAIAAAGILGTAVVAPFAMPSAQADVEYAEMQERIHQEFVPNESAEADLVYTEVPVIELPDPAEERKRLAEEAAEKKAAEEEAAAEEQAGDDPAAPPAADPAAPSKYTGGGAPAEWMEQAGIAEDDWGHVDFIASKESGWNPNATNASSGACGLIQAYPCSKVPGNGYDPVDNLKWANGYAVGRYGSWAEARAFWEANHWW